MKRRNKNKKEKTIAKVIAVGLIISVAVFLCCAAVGALIISSFENPTASIGKATVISFYLSAAVCGFVISKYKGDFGILPVGICALIFCAILMTVGVIVSGGKVPFVTFINFICYLIITLISAYIGKRKKKRIHR